MRLSELHIPRHLEPKEQPIAIACSGGVDSMALLFLLLKYSVTIHVLHVNYKLRGNQSELDQQLLEKYCAKNNLNLHVYSVSDTELIDLKKSNLQAKARTIRYSFFSEMVEKYNLKSVYLGQHQNDQIETFYLRLFRKSGLRGMQAMMPINGKYIRPFLQFSKEQIILFAQRKHIEWREDLSNSSNNYLRNLLRNEAIPLLKKEIPQIEDSVLALIQAFQSTNTFLESKFKNIISDIKTNEKWSFEQFNRMEEQEIIYVAQALGWSANDAISIEQMRKSLKSSNYFTQNGVKITKESKCWSWKKNESPKFELKTSLLTELPIQFEKDVLYLDATLVKGELKARFREEGDRIASVGMKGSQLVSKICKDAKLEQSEKENTIVIHDDENIHWVYLLKVGRIIIANENSINILKVEIVR
jgi:tRNA(Ile)-lysidine synthase